MLYGSMSGHQVEKNVHSSLMYLLKQLLCILIGAVSGRNRVIIRYIVACISKGSSKAGIDPERIAAQILDIIQFGDDSLEVADSVCVGIHKRLGINLIKNCIVKPFCHNNETASLFFLCASLSCAPYHLSWQYFTINLFSVQSCRQTKITKIIRINLFLSAHSICERKEYYGKRKKNRDNTRWSGTGKSL